MVRGRIRVMETSCVAANAGVRSHARYASGQVMMRIGCEACSHRGALMKASFGSVPRLGPWVSRSTWACPVWAKKSMDVGSHSSH